jgi:hypothetical protein
MSPGPWPWLRARLAAMLQENEHDIGQERGGWTHYITDIYAAHYRLHDQRRHDRRKQQWKNYERRNK